MFAPAPLCMPTTPPSRCSRLAWGRPKPVGSGLSFATSGPGARRVNRRRSITTRRISTAIHAKTLLGTCRGFLHADGYAGFETLYRPTTPNGEPNRWSRLHAGAIIWSRFLCGVAGRGRSVGRWRQPAGLRIIFADAWRFADA